ncbi:SMP-30/gluconolactonase/LRE family protein [Phytoactinopolyspora mesophila]|uniref:SMP-30/gluconolactonase/LRE family protein n=1 Tax=Phytoactinopolyspora mesophila TaxID=2650750 RepID=UPI00139197EA
MHAELVAERDGPRTVLGESPRWDGDTWWWVDATDGVWCRRPGGPAVAVWQTGERTSLVHPERSGGVVVARGTDLYLLRQGADGEWRPLGPWCELPLEDGWLVNDGVADSHGRLWIGAIAPDRAPLAGVLLRIEPDGVVHEAADGFTLTNGMAWGPGEKRLYHVDTGERTIWAHEVDSRSGRVLDREPFLDFARDDGLPDGIAMDTDGGIWVAMYSSGQIRRYDAMAMLDVVIDLDTPQCTSVEFGGPDGRDLLITTAREGYDESRSAREPLAGRLFQARTRHAGLGKAKAAVETGTFK